MKDHIEYLEFLTKDVRDIQNKPYLWTALSPHFKKTFPDVEEKEANDIITEWIKQRGE